MLKCPRSQPPSVHSLPLASCTPSLLVNDCIAPVCQGLEYSTSDPPPWLYYRIVLRTLPVLSPRLDSWKQILRRSFASSRFIGECFMGFSGGSVVKNLPVNAGDLGLSPTSGRSPGRGNGNPLQYSCLENPRDRGWGTAHGIAKRWTWLSNWAHTFLE